jgi:hypothetical protein
MQFFNVHFSYLAFGIQCDCCFEQKISFSLLIAVVSSTLQEEENTKNRSISLKKVKSAAIDFLYWEGIKISKCQFIEVYRNHIIKG